MKKYVEGFMRYRHLLKELVIKGIKLKYRRSYLGLVWTLLEPLLMTMTLAFVFGIMLGKNIPNFPVYILCGRLMFSCFSSTSKVAMRSIRANQAMIKKVYVPKYLYPLSTIIYNYILFLISLVILVALALVYQVPFTWHIIEMIIPLTILAILCVGVGLILSTICVFFRDMEYLWDVVLTLIMYCSGIFYSIEGTRVSSTLKTVLGLNPVYCIISNVRCVVMEGGSIFYSSSYGLSNLHMMIYAFVFSVITLIVGILTFKKNQDKFILYI